MQDECIRTFKGTKWRGKDFRVELAKPDFTERQAAPKNEETKPAAAPVAPEAKPTIAEGHLYRIKDPSKPKAVTMSVKAKKPVKIAASAAESVEKSAASNGRRVVPVPLAAEDDGDSTESEPDEPVAAKAPEAKATSTIAAPTATPTESKAEP